MAYIWIDYSLQMSYSKESSVNYAWFRGIMNHIQFNI